MQQRLGLPAYSIHHHSIHHHWPRPSSLSKPIQSTPPVSFTLTTPQTSIEQQTNTTAAITSNTATSSALLDTLPSATPASDTPDDLPNLSLSSDNLDLSASLYFPDNLDDPSNSVDLTWTDLDKILSSEPFASSTPSPKTTVQTPTHAFHPLANTITSHTSSHRFQPYPTSSTTSSSCPSLSHRRITPHITSTFTSSPTLSTSSATSDSSFHTYNTLLLQLFAIHSHKRDRYQRTLSTVHPGYAFHSFSFSFLPSKPPSSRSNDCR